MPFQTIIIGHIGQDATTRTHEGNTCISFSLANTETYKDKVTGEKKESTTWVECSLWRNDLTNLVPYLRKGVQVCVQGKPSARAYKDKNGVERASLSLRVTQVDLLSGGKKDEQQPAGLKQDGYTLPSTTGQPTDDLPF